MEHIRQFDWCASSIDIHFLDEADIDNCVTERILRNKFRDPMVSSDSEEEGKANINWTEVFKRSDNENKPHHVFVPGLHKPVLYPKQSALTIQQHYQCLKVICAENPKVLPLLFIPRPTKTDLRVFEEVKETYMKEQQEFIEWARTMWTNNQCGRALRPKPTIETVYEAEFKMRTTAIEGFPQNYELAAQIPLETSNTKCKIVFDKDLITVESKELPLIQYPDLSKRCTVLRPCPTPEPCNQHPCKFVLPTEKSMSVLPLSEVHREMAQWAGSVGGGAVVAEAALRCLAERNRAWMVPVTVTAYMSPDGNNTNVLVMGSEFNLAQESATRRTYKAYRHLLEYALIPPSEKAKVIDSQTASAEDGQDGDGGAAVSSDDEDQLVIDTGEDEQTSVPQNTQKEQTDQPMETETAGPENETQNDKDNSGSQDGKKSKEYYHCACKESLFAMPPPRSYRSWRVGPPRQAHDLIVHTNHKVRDQIGEVILEPIPEYQIDLGGTKHSEDTIRSLALSLFLRKKASLLNVRIDTVTGEVITVEPVSSEAFLKTHEASLEAAINTIYTTLDQLKGLVPGHYVLQHEPSHGSNALLLVSRAKGSTSLRPDSSTAAPKPAAAPALTTALLPVHKFRRTLPLCFSPFPGAVARAPPKPATKQKPPPQAIRWPKRSSRKKKNNNTSS